MKKSKRIIKWLVVHCTAGWQNETTAEVIKGFRANGWKNNGYHFLISADGTVENITNIDNIANGVAGHNANSIHISYKGGIKKENGKLVAVDNRTPQQRAALVKVLTELKQAHPEAKIKGHRDFSPDKDKDGVIEPFEYIKQCPCFDAIPEYSFIK